MPRAQRKDGTPGAKQPNQGKSLRSDKTSKAHYGKSRRTSKASTHGTKTAALPSAPSAQPSAVEREVLKYLRSIANRGFQTKCCSRAEIAAAIGISLDTVKTAIRRLIEKGHIARVSFSRNKFDGGAVYKLRPFSAAKDHGKHGRPLSQRDVLNERLAKLSRRLRMQEFGLSTHEILAAWSAGPGGSDNDLIESLEHMFARIRNVKPRSITQPRSWVRARLREGYYGPPSPKRHASRPRSAAQASG